MADIGDETPEEKEVLDEIERKCEERKREKLSKEINEIFEEGMKNPSPGDSHDQWMKGRERSYPPQDIKVECPKCKAVIENGLLFDCGDLECPMQVPIRW